MMRVGGFGELFNRVGTCMTSGTSYYFDEKDTKNETRYKVLKSSQ